MSVQTWHVLNGVQNSHLQPLFLTSSAWTRRSDITFGYISVPPTIIFDL